MSRVTLPKVPGAPRDSRGQELRGSIRFNFVVHQIQLTSQKRLKQLLASTLHCYCHSRHTFKICAPALHAKQGVVDNLAQLSNVCDFRNEISHGKHIWKIVGESTREQMNDWT